MLYFETERFTLTTKFYMEMKVTTNTKPQHDALKAYAEQLDVSGKDRPQIDPQARTKPEGYFFGRVRAMARWFT